VRPLDVQRFVNDVARRYAPNTVRTYYALLRAIFNGAVNSDLIGRTPCRGIKLPAARSKAPTSIAVEDIHRLADAVGVEYRAMVYLAAELGLRFGECAGSRSAISISSDVRSRSEGPSARFEARSSSESRRPRPAFGPSPRRSR
jgi:integrase